MLFPGVQGKMHKPHNKNMTVRIQFPMQTEQTKQKRDRNRYHTVALYVVVNYVSNNLIVISNAFLMDP